MPVATFLFFGSVLRIHEWVSLSHFMLHKIDNTRCFRRIYSSKISAVSLVCYVAWPSGEAVLRGQERLPSASPADFSCHWRSKHLSKKGAQSDDQAKKDGPLCLLIDCWDLSKISVDIMVNVMQQTKKKGSRWVKLQFVWGPNERFIQTPAGQRAFGTEMKTELSQLERKGLCQS